MNIDLLITRLLETWDSSETNPGNYVGPPVSRLGKIIPTTSDEEQEQGINYGEQDVRRVSPPVNGEMEATTRALASPSAEQDEKKRRNEIQKIVNASIKQYQSPQEMDPTDDKQDLLTAFDIEDEDDKKKKPSKEQNESISIIDTGRKYLWDINVSLEEIGESPTGINDNYIQSILKTNNVKRYVSNHLVENFYNEKFLVEDEEEKTREQFIIKPADLLDKSRIPTGQAFVLSKSPHFGPIFQQAHRLLKEEDDGYILVSTPLGHELNYTTRELKDGRKVGAYYFGSKPTEDVFIKRHPDLKIQVLNSDDAEELLYKKKAQYFTTLLKERRSGAKIQKAAIEKKEIPSNVTDRIAAGTEQAEKVLALKHQIKDVENIKDTPLKDWEAVFKPLVVSSSTKQKNTEPEHITNRRNQLLVDYEHNKQWYEE